MTPLDNNILVEINQKNIEVEITKPEIIVEVPARQGPAGPGATKSDYSYYHQQVIPDLLWIINHNLGFYPNVLIEDTAGDTVLPNRIEQDGLNTVKIHFTGAMGGKAYLS